MQAIIESGELPRSVKLFTIAQSEFHHKERKPLFKSILSVNIPSPYQSEHVENRIFSQFPDHNIKSLPERKIVNAGQ